MKTWIHRIIPRGSRLVFVFSISLVLTLALTRCGSDKPNPSSAPTTPVTGATAKVSGQVQGAISARRLKLPSRPGRTSSCASAACSTIVVGSGGSGTAGPACTVDGSGNFSISSVPVGQQLEASFSCTGGTQTCIVMSGDAGVTCDPVADAVIKAFLSEMGISGMADSSLAHANVAQIAHSIQTMSQTGTSASNTFLTAVSACSNAACYLNAIKASPFYGPFRLMKTMVLGWDVESIYTLLTDVFGYEVGLDPMTYSPFGSNLDTWLSTDFIAKTKTFVAAMLADQVAGGNTYASQIVCEMSYMKYMAGGTINYNPTLITVKGVSNVPSCKESTSSPNPLTQNGLNYTQIGLVNDAIDNNSNGQIQLGSSSCSGMPDANTFCVQQPRLVIKSRASEPNRNDPLGTNNNNFIQYSNVSMINAFAVVLTTLGQATVPNDTTAGPNLGQPCMTMSGKGGGGGGAPNVINDAFCVNWFGTLFSPAVKNGFAGVIGLYMALKNNSLGSNNLLSLNDLYTLFSSSNFLGTKLTNQSNFSGGINYNQNGGGTNFLASLLNDPNPSAPYSGNFTMDASFLYPSQTPVSYTTVAALYNAATFGYNDSFKQFENIPTGSDIHGFVFKSAYHVDYNPTGNSTFYAAGGKVVPSGNTGDSTADPIFCKMSNANGPVEVDMGANPNVTVTCNDAATLGVTVDENGKVTVPANFAYPYMLNQWGYQGDSAGSIFMLVDRSTGFPIMPNGHQQFVYQLSGGNPNSVCNGSANPTDTGTVVSTNISVGNGASMVSQLVTAYCLDMSAFSTTNQLGFYFAGNSQISQNNPNCPTCTMGVGVVGGLNTNIANNFTTPSVCVFAPDSALTVTTGVAVAGSGGVVINGSGHITNMGNLIVDFCSETHGGTTTYDLISVNGWGATSDSTLFAQLIPTTSGSSPLLWETFPTTNEFFDPTTYFLSVDAGTLNDAFEATYSKADHSYRVAPTSPPTQIQGISLQNAAWQTKFDPYCDSVEGDGKCHCLDGTTGAAKSGVNCTLEDTPTDPTMSSPPYWAMPGQAPTKALAFFTAYAGKSGSDLVDTNSVGLNWNSTNWTGSGGTSIMNVNINLQQGIVCKYLATGETTYRHPTQTSNVWSHNQGGCPDSNGSITTFSCNNDCQSTPSTPVATGGGPIRIVNPVPMNNAYAVLTPNSAMKLINYATKDTGQGITITSSQKLFTFDTGLALIAFRSQFPLTGITVTAGGNPVAGPLGVFQRVNNPALTQNNNGSLDPVSSVLCYLTNNGQACSANRVTRENLSRFVD